MKTIILMILNNMKGVNMKLHVYVEFMLALEKWTGVHHNHYKIVLITKQASKLHDNTDITVLKRQTSAKSCIPYMYFFFQTDA